MNSNMEMSNLFHTILFAYQKSVKDILGTGEACLIHPILEKILFVTHKQNETLIEEEPEKYLELFLENLLKNGTVKWVNITEASDGQYVFHVEGCKFSKDIHQFLNTKDTTCPLALVVMAFLELYAGEKVRPTDSTYSQTGTKTVIEFLSNPKKEKTALPPVQH
jgi:hypothetical protein